MAGQADKQGTRTAANTVLITDIAQPSTKQIL
jgi:hypothetical protein